MSPFIQPKNTLEYLASDPKWNAWYEIDLWLFLSVDSGMEELIHTLLLLTNIVINFIINP